MKRNGHVRTRRALSTARGTVLLTAVLILLSLLLSGCNEAQERMLRRLVATEGGGYKGEEVSEERVRELEREINKFHDEVTELVKKKGQLGVLYRMLALEYVDRDMYGPALENLKKGLSIYPNNHTMLYYAGLCTGQMAKSKPNEEQRMEGLRDAAHYYRRAIELRSSYVEAQYALAVLYVFELDRPEDAVPHLEKILELQSGHTRAKFLLARVRVEQNRREEALALYEEIISESGVEEFTRRARENREELLQRMGGGNG